MIERFTFCKLNTCDCQFTMKFTFQDENDTTPTESLSSYTAKCETHANLSDQAAYEAALDLCRTINLGEGYEL
jgi:hypothetical protein